MTTVKFKIVHINQDRPCYYCKPYKEPYKEIKKGSLAVSISGHPRCLNCGLKKLKRHKEIYEQWAAEINSVIEDLNTKYPKEMIIERMI